jgi:hypothetical protein
MNNSLKDFDLPGGPGGGRGRLQSPGEQSRTSYSRLFNLLKNSAEQLTGGNPKNYFVG